MQLFGDRPFLVSIDELETHYFTIVKAGCPQAVVPAIDVKGNTESTEALLTPRCVRRRIAKLHRAEIEGFGIDWNAGWLCVQRRFWT